VTGLSVEELLAMESQTREAIEARINCLRNIQTFLDAAVLQLHQYNSVAMALKFVPYVFSKPSSSYLFCSQ
jgi:hypothetical protein